MGGYARRYFLLQGQKCSAIGGGRRSRPVRGINHFAQVIFPACVHFVYLVRLPAPARSVLGRFSFPSPDCFYCGLMLISRGQRRLSAATRVSAFFSHAFQA